MLVFSRTTTRADGDFADPARFDSDVTWLRQVHGADVVVVTRPGEHAGAEADAAVTASPGCKLVVRTADCVPVVLSSPNVLGIAHAGWRGVMAGVLRNTVDSMRELGAERISASIGPHIGTECYEFGEDELVVVASRYGDGVRGTTRDPRPALDLGAAAAAALAEAGVDEIANVDECTSCLADRYYSWRARQETERFATIAWLEP